MVIAYRAAGRRTVVIDRGNGSVVLQDGAAFRERRRTRRLAAYRAVAVWERRSPVDAGYFVSRYSVVLIGSDGPLPLLATGDEREALRVRNEIAAFLRMPDVPSGRPA
jgi:hypothetical protein